MFRNRKKQEELEDEPAFFENVAVPATEMIPQPKQEEVEKMENKQTINAEESVLTEDVTINGDLECECNLMILQPESQSRIVLVLRLTISAMTSTSIARELGSSLGLNSMFTP